MRPESIGEEAKITDSDEALRQQLQEETAQELGCQQRHLALLATTRIVLPTEGNAFAVECQQPVIGNGDPVRIPAEIAQDFCRSAEGGFGVDHPVLTVHPAKKLAKLFWISQCGCWAGAAQLLASMETFQIPSHGALLNALAYVAEGAGPHPVVILLHGFPGNEKNLDMAQAIRRDGWDVVYFDYRGSWGSPGDFSFTHSIEDTQAAVAYLRDAGNAKKLRAAARETFLKGCMAPRRSRPLSRPGSQPKPNP